MRRIAAIVALALLLATGYWLFVLSRNHSTGAPPARPPATTMAAPTELEIVVNFEKAAGRGLSFLEVSRQVAAFMSSGKRSEADALALPVHDRSGATVCTLSEIAKVKVRRNPMTNDQ